MTAVQVSWLEPPLLQAAHVAVDAAAVEADVDVEVVDGGRKESHSAAAWLESRLEDGSSC
jgi:hypothetical protein